MYADANHANQQDYEALTNSLREKDAELREIQHRAKNSLQLVISLLKLQVNRIRDPEARAAYDQTLQRIDALAILYRRLHERGSTGSAVALGDYLTEMARAVVDSAVSPQDRIPIEVVAEPVSISLYTAMPLGLIVNELLYSIRGHAFAAAGGEKRWSRVDVLMTAPNTLRISLCDNGRALPPGLDPDYDASMLLIEALAGQINATLTRSIGGAGTTITLDVPV